MDWPLQGFLPAFEKLLYRELKTLSLVAMGAEDHVFFQAARRFANTHAKAHLVIFDKCGHICNIEQYEEFNQTALSFLLPEEMQAVSRINAKG